MNEKLAIDNIRKQVVGVDTKVPMLDGTYRAYTNFDNASTAPTLKPVLDKVNEFMGWYASVGRGAGFKSNLCTEVLEEVRGLIYKFVGASSEQHAVIFGKNTTEAINKLAHRLPFSPGDIVLSSMMEHHSNDLPWRAVADVRYIGVDKRGALDIDHLERLIQQYSDKVQLVSITGASNVTGYINPIYEIAEIVHSVEAKLCVDAAQLVPHRKVSMGNVEDAKHIDYLAFCAHKMYAPFGIGVLVGLRESFLRGSPDFVGGGTVDLVTPDRVLWANLPAREEAGTPNVVGAVALAKAMLCLQEIGLDEIAHHEACLTSYLLGRLANIEQIIVYGDDDPERSITRLGVVPIEVEGVAHQLVSAILAMEGGIAVRNGLFCAHPYALHLLKASAAKVNTLASDLKKGVRSQLPGLTRISFGMYNCESEVDVLVELLERICQGRYQGQYVQDLSTGQFSPQGFSFPTKECFSIKTN